MWEKKYFVLFRMPISNYSRDGKEHFQLIQAIYCIYSMCVCIYIYIYHTHGSGSQNSQFGSVRHRGVTFGSVRYCFKT